MLVQFQLCILPTIAIAYVTRYFSSAPKQSSNSSKVANSLV